MGMKPRTTARALDPVLHAKAVEAVEAAACYLQEETMKDGEYRFTDAQAFSIIKRTANRMVAGSR